MRIFKQSNGPGLQSQVPADCEIQADNREIIQRFVSIIIVKTLSEPEN